LKLNISKEKYMAAITYFTIMEERRPDERELLSKAMAMTDEDVESVKSFAENFTKDEIEEMVKRAKKNITTSTTQ
jgi:hypothetical protein